MNTRQSRMPDVQSERTAAMPTIFVISPAYNEAAVLTRFTVAIRAMYEEQLAIESYSVRLILVDDGSSDGTFAEMTRLSQSMSAPGFSVTGVRLSRNFGQQSAIHAGLEFAFRRSRPGDRFIIMDSDLQHPPKYVSAIARALVDVDHVQMVRKDSADAGVLKRLTSWLFYFVFRHLAGLQMPAGASDFRGMSYRFVREYLLLRESGRFNRGLFYWIGFPRYDLAYEADPRGGGETKYSTRRMFELALVAISQFSSKPLTWMLGAIVFLSFSFCFVYLVYAIVTYLSGGYIVPGWSSVMFLISFWSGMIVLGQLLLAIYIARVFDEVKRRPIYVQLDTTEESHEADADIVGARAST